MATHSFTHSIVVRVGVYRADPAGRMRSHSRFDYFIPSTDPTPLSDAQVLAMVRADVVDPRKHQLYRDYLLNCLDVGNVCIAEYDVRTAAH